jgi:L-ribulose-5-phosphate 3-epimerase
MNKYKNNPFGVMQGRLLPKFKGRYQAHPLGYWQDEFTKAKEVGLNCIEFILDFNDAEENPLLSSKGVEEILKVSEKTGVKVHTVCADYFMEAPLHSENIDIVKQSQKVLSVLLDNGKILKLSDIVMPCVDQSSLKDTASQDQFYDKLSPLLEKAENYNINISLETDLPPEPFAKLVNRFNSTRVTVNYDTGNSASLGFDPVEELACYGDKISDIHIKDRVLGGGSVILGTGNTQFESFFNALKRFNYQGPFIMQAFRDDEGVEIFKKQLKWVRERFFMKVVNGER